MSILWLMERSVGGFAESSVGNNPEPRRAIARVWPVGAPTPGLADREVQVWQTDLQPPAERLRELAATLTADERDRAARFRFSEHRERFIAGRGLLRDLLGRILDRPAAALRFIQGPHGKPMLAGEDAAAGLGFNLSHSGDRALYAVARRAVGVDLEVLERTVTYADVAKRVCTPREWVVFQTLPTERAREAFFTCWTRKEAIAKALGAGLASGLRTLEVCFREDAGPDGRTCWRDGEGREWSVLNLPLGSDWSGALAAAGADWRWRGWRWTDGG
ncbi:MAG: 4'-phosphopantetheinyl transferase superfamily protein [Candidatus Competibacteraceae bacterium]|nr:MAG: 4'-phosphopantetheinyl transferase superfamily protein [Candidatus Competibacteraceae bacterium]